MAYAPAGSSAGANPPVLALQPMAFGGGSTYGSTKGSTAWGGRLWFYQSTHVQATVGTSDFVSDGQSMGMKLNDIVFQINDTAGASIHRVTAVGSTFVSLSAGLMVSSAS